MALPSSFKNCSLNIEKTPNPHNIVQNIAKISSMAPSVAEIPEGTASITVPVKSVSENTTDSKPKIRKVIDEEENTTASVSLSFGYLPLFDHCLKCSLHMANTYCPRSTLTTFQPGTMARNTLLSSRSATSSMVGMPTRVSRISFQRGQLTTNLHQQSALRCVGSSFTNSLPRERIS